jgi:hypothetical protein
MAVNPVNAHPVRVKTADGWQELALTGPPGPPGPGVPTPVVNGQWIKGVSGAAVWSPINFTDIGGTISDAQLPARLAGSMPKVTISPIQGGSPASPNNGDIWYATNVGSQNDRWAFQYNSSATYKWEFIGGTPLRASVSAFVGGTTGGNWTDYGGPEVYWPCVGELFIRFGASFDIFNENSLVAIFAAGTQVTDILENITTVVGSQRVASSMDHFGVLWGPASFKMMYQCTQTADWGRRWLEITPVRIS